MQALVASVPVRDVMVKIRTTSTARVVWQRSAEAAGMSLSDYVRKSVAAFRRGHTADVAAELVRLRQELNAIGNNLNQATKRLHGTGETVGLQSAADAARTAADAVRTALEAHRL